MIIKNDNIINFTEDIVVNFVDNKFSKKYESCNDIFNNFHESKTAYNEIEKMLTSSKLLGRVQLIKYDNGKSVANIFIDKSKKRNIDDINSYRDIVIGLSSLFSSSENKSIAIKYDEYVKNSIIALSNLYDFGEIVLYK